MPDQRKEILSLSFEVTLFEVRGGLNIAVPVTLSHALLRKIAGESRDTRPRGPAEWRERLQRRLLECPFLLDLAANGLSASFGELSKMEPGQVLSLRRSAAAPATLMVAGVEMFGALPARCGEARAAQLLAAVKIEEATMNQEAQKR